MRIAAALLLAVLLLGKPASGAERDAAAADWPDFQVIIWQTQTAAALAALQPIGLTAAAVIPDRAAPQHIDDAALDPIVAARLRPYLENVATDFYAAYHRFTPGRVVNWRFLETQQLYRTNPDAPAAFRRDPSLSDPAWLAKIRDRLHETVATYRRFRPVFYNLADESGIADLNAYWDFDFSPVSLAAMRRWLKSRYGSLAALNAEWGARFPDWNAVVPTTTAAIMQRGDENFASWADFKDWMDLAFARAARAGTDALHDADPTALAGLEGVQKPGWGGYDYALLTGAVDVMEAYEPVLARSLNPRLHLLLTTFGSGPLEAHRIWAELLDGVGGAIIWDDKHDLLAADGTLSPRGRFAAAIFPELRSGIGALILNARPPPSPVAILYSQPSLRTQWLLDWKGKGDAWLGRDADTEDRDDGTVRAAMTAYERGLDQLGVAPGYVSSAMVEGGALRRAGTRVLVLPHAIALSAAEVQAIRDFAARDGLVIADAAPGLFDEHGRKLPAPRLAALFHEAGAPGRPAQLVPPGTPLAVENADPYASLGTSDLGRLRAALASVGVGPPVALRDATGATPSDVTLRLFRDGAVTILALQRDYDAAAKAPACAVTVTLPAPAYAYDIRGKSFLGRVRELRLDLDPAAPTILALSPAALPPPVLTLAPIAHPGRRVTLRLGLAARSRARFHVLHVEVTDPAGRAVAADAANVILRGAAAVTDLRLAPGAPVGTWHVQVIDVLSGQSAMSPLTVAN